MINIDNIKKFYELLGHRYQTEIRVFELSKNFKVSKCVGHYFVSSEKEFIKKCKEFNGKCNLYAGLNERIKQGTEAKDVKSVKNIFIDIDCKTKPSSKEDLKEAEKVTDTIILDLKEEMGAEPTKIFSGNGYQLIYCIPQIEITEENREEVQSKIKQFTTDLISKYSNDKVKLDNVGDLPRIIRITGTINIKGGNLSEFSKINNHESLTLKDYILNLKLNFKTATKLKNKTEEIELTKRFYEVLEKDEKIKKLYNGDFEGYDLSIGGELALVCSLIQYNFDKKEVFNIMASSKIGRWSERGISYREETYKKALAIISEEKKLETQPIAHEGDLDIKTISDYRKLKVDKNYIVQNFLYPKTINMIYSPPANFKSLIAEDMGLSIASGKNFMNMKTKKQSVLYCDGENADIIVKERLIQFHKGKNMKRWKIPYYILKNGILLDEKKQVHLGFLVGLEKAIIKYKIKILIFDTMHRFAFYDENKADDINMLYTKVFKPLVEDYGLTIVFLHHSKKDGGYRGSGDFLGMVDVCYKVLRNGKTDKFKIFNEKCRSGEIKDISGEIDFGEDYIKIMRLDEKEETEKKISKLKEITNKIRELFKEGVELKRKDIIDKWEIEDYKFSLATLKRSLKYLVDNNYLDKTEKGVYSLILYT